MSTEAHVLPGADLAPERMPGHLLLARVGKRVLRPGGARLTDRLLRAAAITATDDVIELGPGVGATAERLCRLGPASYTGVERDPRAATVTGARLGGVSRRRCITASAQATTLPDGAATVVVGEAMLTMQREPDRGEIVAEAWRLLRPGGRYVVHELALVPDDLGPATARELCDALSRTIHVGARPQTAADWRQLLTDQGFVVAHELRAPMRLLEPTRAIGDERLGAARIAGNLLRDREARRRVLAMRRLFRRHRRHLGAIGLVAVKPQ